MKGLLTALILVCLVFSSASFVYADGPIEKLGRGVANVLTSIFEIPKGMGDVANSDGVFAGVTYGTFKGVINTVKRTLVGGYEIVTFPIPFPNDYGPILKDPEFFLKKALS
ncbi:MAG: exosortase system-associated protein, TIGR04073 family [Candidatus Omnitrophica bacterium]|nr:exosortase system-associated protein, TIGR04073 family [Candidatus Omnitrophota bacterium]